MMNGKLYKCILSGLSRGAAKPCKCHSSADYQVLQVCLFCHSEPMGNASVGATLIRTIVNRTLVSTNALAMDGVGFIFTDNIQPENHTYVEGTYSGNQDKIWQIRIPRQCRLEIIFSEFDIESTKNCDKDFFAVQITKKKKGIRKYCKSLESITIQRRRRVQLWFHADEEVQRRGIFAQFCFSAIARMENSFPCDCNLVWAPTMKRRARRLTGM